MTDKEDEQKIIGLVKKYGRGNKFKFTEKGVSKEEIMRVIDSQRDLDDELLREKYEHHNDPREAPQTLFIIGI